MKLSSRCELPVSSGSSSLFFEFTIACVSMAVGGWSAQPWQLIDLKCRSSTQAVGYKRKSCVQDAALQEASLLATCTPDAFLRFQAADALTKFA